MWRFRETNFKHILYNSNNSSLSESLSLEETRQLCAHEGMGQPELLIFCLKYHSLSVFPPKSLPACWSMISACSQWHPQLNPHWSESQILPPVFKSSYDAVIPGCITFTVTKTYFIGKIRTILNLSQQALQTWLLFYHSFTMHKISKQINKGVFGCLTMTLFSDEILIRNIHS